MSKLALVVMFNSACISESRGKRHRAVVSMQHWRTELT